MTGRERVREGRPADLPTLQAIQATVLAEPWQELLAVAVDGPPILLVATERSDHDVIEPDNLGGSGSDNFGGSGSDDQAVSDERGDAPVGYALAVSDGDDEAAYLAELAVSPAHQGSGHGSALLDALLDRLEGKGVEELRVTVRTVDEQARAFYQDRGFETRERIPDHYETGDGLLLARDVSE